MEHRQRAYRASLVCLVGCSVQVIYGVCAIFFPYPQIIERLSFDILWAIANVGMIGGVIGLLALDVGRPRALALTGGAIAILGYAARAALSLIPVFPGVDMAVVATIPPMVLGVGLLGIATVRGKRLPGWQAWSPLLSVAAALVTIAAFSIQESLNFILLGLLWGPAWLLVGGVVFRQASSRAQRAEAQAPMLTAIP